MTAAWAPLPMRLGRRSFAVAARRARRRDCDRGRGGDGLSARRRRALGGASPSACWKSWRGSSARLGTLDGGSRGHSGARSATRRRSPPRGRSARAMSGAFRRRPRRGVEVGRALVEQRRGRGALRLGRWPDLGGAAALRRCRSRRSCVRSSASAGGHATLIRAPAAVRAAVDVFEPEAPALAALTKRVQARASIRAGFSIPAGCGRESS